MPLLTWSAAVAAIVRECHQEILISGHLASLMAHMLPHTASQICVDHSLATSQLQAALCLEPFSHAPLTP